MSEYMFLLDHQQLYRQKPCKFEVYIGDSKMAYRIRPSIKKPDDTKQPREPTFSKEKTDDFMFCCHPDICTMANPPHTHIK